MTEQHTYRVEGQRQDGKPWQLVLSTTDPVEAMDCAHYIEGWFWRRVWEDENLIIERM